MADEPWSDTEKKLAKRLKRLARDEGTDWKHMHCLRLVRKYHAIRPGLSAEGFAALVWEKEAGVLATPEPK